MYLLKSFLPYLALGLLLLVILPVPAGAQVGGNVFSDLSITLNPEKPEPFESVTATIDDYSLGSVGGDIIWRLNGTDQPDAENSRSLTFIAPAAGESTTVTANYRSPQGNFTASKTITPYYLDIIAEAQTYTPGFYRGAALPVFGSRILLTALIHNQAGPLNAASYSYRWKVANKVLNGGAVKGGFQTYATVPHGRYLNIEVEVLSSQGQTLAKKTITIPSVAIDVQLYEFDSLFGIKNKALKDNQPFVGNSLTVQAVPYYMDNAASLDKQSFVWKINGLTQELGSDPFQIVINRSNRNIDLGFRVMNTEIFLQNGQKNISLAM